MRAPIVHAASSVHCSHGGTASPTAWSERVTVSGEPVITAASAYAIADCPWVPPAGDGPCVSGRFIAGAARVLAEGVPVAIEDRPSICQPTGTPLVVVAVPSRVLAS